MRLHVQRCVFIRLDGKKLYGDQSSVLSTDNSAVNVKESGFKDDFTIFLTHYE